MREGIISSVMAADRPYDEFYDFYSVSPEYFGRHLVRMYKVCGQIFLMNRCYDPYYFE
jgi:hypothetical protein